MPFRTLIELSWREKKKISLRGILDYTSKVFPWLNYNYTYTWKDF